MWVLPLRESRQYNMHSSISTQDCHRCIVCHSVSPSFSPTAQQMTKEFRPDPSEKRYTFDDVQGIEEAKDEVKELVEFLRNPEKFQRLGAKLPTGRWKNGYIRCVFVRELE